MDKVEGNEKDEFRSEEENNKHLGFSDISDESSVSDKEDEFSESDSDKESSGEPTAKEKLVNIIARSVWDPDPGDPAKDKELQQPFNHINYVDTDTPMCDNQEDCMDVMRHLKERDKTIKYNFYIGGDNLIYEGKGWVADVNEATGYRKRCLDVAFIGVFSVIRPSPPMLINAFHLVELGISTDKVLKGFTNDFRMCNRLD
ncbi:peptidoglycan-recognition protein SB2-like isoform X2 [Macrosteles quadrilineatus]|uniref:peptidoglycan-recognition protein SB2-like isoform X2 n=1 Tax=Macrosteles quadrilineatus TaxID=74068 RepID=UPI0023E2EBEC|nr:peptidoglycan-recognition protein SB2-like isoform X2 [Macrosteles quadrilineatus]